MRFIGEKCDEALSPDCIGPSDDSVGVFLVALGDHAEVHPCSEANIEEERLESEEMAVGNISREGPACGCQFQDIVVVSTTAGRRCEVSALPNEMCRPPYERHATQLTLLPGTRRCTWPDP